MAVITHLLDASGILRGSLDWSGRSFGITKSVLDEVRSGTAGCAIEEAVARGDVRVLPFGAGSLVKAREAASKTGDIHSLSGPDLDVLAAALEHGLTIVSDDYAIQNTAATLGIRTEGTSQEPIRRRIVWAWVCGGCGRGMGGPGSCGVCGHRGRRKPA
jgi:endoribonuclease Nob1